METKIKTFKQWKLIAKLKMLSLIFAVILSIILEILFKVNPAYVLLLLLIQTTFLLGFIGIPVIWFKNPFNIDAYMDYVEYCRHIQKNMKEYRQAKKKFINENQYLLN